MVDFAMRKEGGDDHVQVAEQDGEKDHEVDGNGHSF